eukprot:scaffold649133_cov34-Prasinocladus_malaysianus.AAC.1
MQLASDYIHVKWSFRQLDNGRFSDSNVVQMIITVGRFGSSVDGQVTWGGHAAPKHERLMVESADSAEQ